MNAITDIIRCFNDVLGYINRQTDTAISQPVATAAARSLIDKFMADDMLLKVVLECAVYPAILTMNLNQSGKLIS